MTDQTYITPAITDDMVDTTGEDIAHEERALAQTNDVRMQFFNIVQDMQPVFQQAHAAATTEADRALVEQRWLDFQEAANTVVPWTEAIKTTVVALKSQRDVAVTDLSNLVDEIRKATQDQRSAPNWIGDPEDDAPLDRVDEAYQRYREEIAELLVATEDRINSELEYERDTFYTDVYPRVARETLDSIAAFVTVRCDVNDHRYGKALMPLIGSTRGLTDDEKNAARVVLERLLETL